MGTRFRARATFEGALLEEIKNKGLRALWVQAEPLAGGRGTARKLQLSGRSFLVKRESRGGLSAGFLPDRYLTRVPFETEWAVTDYLAGQGLAPGILAREYVRSGLLLSVYSLFEFFPEAVSLADIMKAGQCDDVSFTGAGRGVGRVHKAGVVHADLNAGNILLLGNDSVFLIDFRHSVRTGAAPPVARRRRNLDRLARSLHKLRIQGGMTWETPPWLAIAEGYTEGWGCRETWLHQWVLESDKPPARLRRIAW